MHNQDVYSPPSQLPVDNTPAPDHNEGLKSILATVLLIAAAPLIAVIFTMFVFQSYEVDGPSMQSTLQNQDRLIVYKLPRTISRVTKKTFMPKRYDIVVFTREELASDGFTSEGNKQLIKRVVGLPGERVVVSNDKLTVYNKEHPEGFDPDGGKQYAKTITVTPGNVDLVVPPNEVFLSGDNRTNSLDSRYFGTVPTSDIVGKLVMRLWPESKTF